jgi:hypothetical protein
MSRQRQALELAENVPVLRNIADRVYTRHFMRARGMRRLFRGIYPNFVAAEAAIPAACLSGFDSELAVERLAHEKHIIFAHD